MLLRQFTRALALTVAAALLLAPQAMAKEVKGKVLSLSNKAKTIQLAVNGKKEIIRFDNSTKFVNARNSRDIKVNDAVLIDFEVGSPAKKITRKVIKLPKNMVISTREVAKLVAKGGSGHLIIDARPKPRYDEGHIPGAVSIPVGKLKKNPKLLPKNKKQLLVFYCGGPT